MSEDRLRAQIATLHWVMKSGRITDWSLALDCGAFEGHWTEAMSRRFDRVLAFEPSAYNYARLVANVGGRPHIELHRAAVFSHRRSVAMVETKSKHSAAHYIKLDDDGDVSAIAIDDLLLPSCGLIKLDVEGAEHEALRGARGTIDRYRPVLIVEMKGLETRFGNDAGAVRALVENVLGYRQVYAARPDFVFVPS